MILKKITIENFRCFKNYEVDLTPGITVFIGRNGSGKTSLLNAIRYGLSIFFSKYPVYCIYTFANGTFQS